MPELLVDRKLTRFSPLIAPNQACFILMKGEGKSPLVVLVGVHLQ